MTYRQLYQKMTRVLSQRLKAATQPQIRNLALMTIALGCSPNSHLSSLATYMPIPGQRENLIQRIRRWLANEAVTDKRCYQPLVRHMLANWPHREVNLVMDRTDLEDRHSVLLVGLAFRHRVLPLAWKVQPFGATNSQSQIALLGQVQRLMPPDNPQRVTFYGDSEFRAVALQRYCQEQGWGWHIGVKSDTLFKHPHSATWQALRTIPIERQERRYLSGITFTRDKAFGPVNLMVDWTHNDDSPRYVVTDRPATGRTWRHGRKRFWIEPTFRDWKSYGFDLERSHIAQVARLDTLLLGLAVTTLWLFHIGCWVERTGRRTWLEASHKRDYSLFRLGRDYLTRSFVRGWHLPVGFTP